jgi:hypothetical protein
MGVRMRTTCFALSAYCNISLRSPAANVSQPKVLTASEYSLSPLNRTARWPEGNTQSALHEEVLQLKGDMNRDQPMELLPATSIHSSVLFMLNSA